MQTRHAGRRFLQHGLHQVAVAAADDLVNHDFGARAATLRDGDIAVDVAEVEALSGVQCRGEPIVARWLVAGFGACSRRESSARRPRWALAVGARPAARAAARRSWVRIMGVLG